MVSFLAEAAKPRNKIEGNARTILQKLSFVLRFTTLL